MNRREFVAACAYVPFIGSRLAAQVEQSPASWAGKAAAGQPVNLAAFGQLKTWLDTSASPGPQHDMDVLRLSPSTGNQGQKDIGVEWPEFRTINQAIIRFSGNPPEDGTIFLEYWEGLTALQGSWKAFEQGLTNGNHLQVQQDSWTYKFEQRRTCKVRLRAVNIQREIQIKEFSILGPSVWKSGDVRIEWGHSENGPGEGRLESYNTQILGLKPLGTTKLKGRYDWNSNHGEASGVNVSFLYTWGMDVDRSILTVVSQNQTCSFLAGEAVEGEPIDIVNYGLYVRARASDPDAAAYRSANRDRSRIIDAVSRHEEQSLENAYANIKSRRITLSFVGAEANNQKFGIAPDGHLVVGSGDPLSGDPMVPKFAVYFDTAEQPFQFELPAQPAGILSKEDKTDLWVTPKQQRLKDGWLPILITEWSQNGLAFERTDFGTLTNPEVSSDKLIGNEPAVLISRLKIGNSSPVSTLATYFIRPWKPVEGTRFPYGPLPADIRESWTTGLSGDVVIASSSDTQCPVCFVDHGGKGELSLDPANNAVQYRLHLEPGQEHTIHTVIPGWSPKPDQASMIRGLDYQALEDTSSKYWMKRASEVMGVTVPDRHLQNIFNASIQHFLLALTKNGNKRECYPNVAMLHYGSIGSESSPIIRALDMRGLHDVAEQCLEAFLSTQSDFMPEGDYDSKTGGFYRFWPIYTVDQGGVLWALADHYEFTRDDDWLRRVASKMIAGCDFILRARKHTMKLSPDGRKPLHYGLAPAGCVADPRDWQYSFMLNAWFYAGLKKSAAVLAHIDSAKAKAIEAETADYKECILRAFKASVDRSPVTRLRDNTSVPSSPPYLGPAGFSTDVKDSVDPDRRHGYAYDCTIGPFHLFNCGVLEADDPLVTAMLNYFEDRFFLFTPLPSRVNLDEIATDWFNLGGFEKLQPYYVHYQEAYLRRDQIPHFIRGFYNTLAATADPDTLTFQEELDFGGGQPHKTHEEGWFCHQMRDMLVVELGNELHLARGTPRRWLNDGQEISIQRAPTYFGRVSYKLHSSAASGTISADIDFETKRPPSRTVLRLRHPAQRRMKEVQVNGQSWSKFDAAKEEIELPASTPKVSVVAHYEGA